VSLCYGYVKGVKNMWEAEREFELYEEFRDYEEDDGTDVFADLEFNSSVVKEDEAPEYQEDFYDNEEDLDY